MTDQGKTVLELPVKTAVANTDRLILVYNAASANSTSSGNAQTVTITCTNFKAIPIISDPADSNALTVQQGTVLASTSFLYVATANNVVKRVALSSF